jgi:hypothetical protein
VPALLAHLLVAIHPILSSPTSHVLAMILLFFSLFALTVFFFYSYLIRFPPIDTNLVTLFMEPAVALLPLLFSVSFLLSLFAFPSLIFLCFALLLFSVGDLYTILITIYDHDWFLAKKYCSLIPNPPRPGLFVWFSSVCYCMCS